MSQNKINETPSKISLSSSKTSEFSANSSKLSKNPSKNSGLLKKTRYFYKSLDVDSLEEVAKVSYFMKREYNESTGELEYN